MRLLYSAGRSSMGPSLRIDFGVYFLLAVWLLILPAEWLLGAVLAAAVHELCHYVAAKAMGISCLGLRIGAGGMEMELAPMRPKEERIVAAAGPMGSLMLLCFSRMYPQLAVCGMVQGLFNLIPIWPLDGGRILYSLFPDREKLCRGVEIGAAAALLCLGIWLWAYWNMGCCPFLLAEILTAKAFLRKIPCNEGKLGVQ